MYIEKLHALQELKICHNLLQCLPSSIGNFDNLEILDVSHNCLLYLPIHIFRIRPHMDISKNPFLSIKFHYNRNECNAIPTLVELSANIVLKHRFVFIIFIFLLLFLFVYYFYRSPKIREIERIRRSQNYVLPTI